MKAFSYINLDGVVAGKVPPEFFITTVLLLSSCSEQSGFLKMIFFFFNPGRNGFKVAGSPLMRSLIYGALNEVSRSRSSR